MRDVRRREILFSIFPALFVALFPLLGVVSADSFLHGGTLVAHVTGIALCALGARLFSREEVLLSLPILSFIALFLGAATASVLISDYAGSDSWWGAGFEFGTWGSFLLFAGAVFCGSMIPRALENRFVHVFIESASVVAAVSLLAWVFGDLAGTAETAAGSWQQISFLVWAALLSTLLLFDEKRAPADAPWIVFPLIAGCALFFFPAASVAFLLSAAGSVVYLYLRRGIFAVRTGAAAVIVLLMMVFGFSGIMAGTAPDAHPSRLAAGLVLAPLYQESRSNALMGSGPGTASAVWERHRTQQFNTSPLWDVRVEVVHSTAATVALLLGALGAGLLLFWPLVFVCQSRELSDTALLALGAFFFVSLFLYPTGLIAFLALGVFFGTCGRSDSHGTSWMLRWMIAFVCVAAGLALVWISAHQMFAARLHAKGIALMRAGDLSAVSMLEKAAHVWGTERYYIDTSRAYVDKARQSIGSFRESDAVRRDVQIDLKAAANFANRAVESNPKDVYAWMYRAELYIALIPLGFPDAEQLALESLQQADSLSPLKPELPLLKARGALQAGNIDAARQFVDAALVLKPDYGEAKQFLEGLSAPSVQ